MTTDEPRRGNEVATGRQNPAGEIPPDAKPVARRRRSDAEPKAQLLTLDALDGRTAAAKRVQGLMGDMATDLGGTDYLSAAQHQLVQRAAVLGAICEDAEARWIGGQPFDVASYLTSINAQRRVLADLGLERRARDVSDLDAYLSRQRTSGPETKAAGHTE